MSKRYRLYFISFIVLVLTTLGLSITSAQESLDQQPLMKMLARIPNTSASRTEIYFNDRAAVEAAYPPAKMPKNWAEFDAISKAKGENPDLLPVDLWWRVWRNQQSALTARYLVKAADSPSVVGFDYFQIEQEMTYGTPPSQTLQLMGPFDLDKVRAALTSQGYTQQDQSGVEVWCGPDGCDSGSKVNVKDRQPANLFGGDLGRKWPVIMLPDGLIGSPDLSVIKDHAANVKDNKASLATLPQYRAAVDAITSGGNLLQAYVWDGEVLAQMRMLSLTTAVLGSNAKPEVVKKFLQEMLKDYKPIPMYELLVFADVATESEQVGEVALVYSSEDDAKAAAEVLPQRIDTYVSLTVKKPLIELLHDRKVDSPKTEIVESNGKYVLVLKLATPKATIEELQKLDIKDPNPPAVTAPGLIYRLLVNAAMQRDLGWLSSIPLADLEAAAK